VPSSNFQRQPKNDRQQSKTVETHERQNQNQSLSIRIQKSNAVEFTMEIPDTSLDDEKDGSSKSEALAKSKLPTVTASSDLEH